MANTVDHDEQVIVIDVVENPVLTHADAVFTGWTAELPRPLRTGIVRQPDECRPDPFLDVARECGELLPRRIGQNDAVPRCPGRHGLESQLGLELLQGDVLAAPELLARGPASRDVVGVLPR
jgi:hypothetical protein